MGEVVNLRLARKAKARAAGAKATDAARAKSGESKATKALRLAEHVRANHLLDNAKREPE